MTEAAINESISTDSKRFSSSDGVVTFGMVRETLYVTFNPQRWTFVSLHVIVDTCLLDLVYR